MTALRTLWSILSARWFLTLSGAVLLAALVWLAGDLLAIGARRPLESEVARLVAILAIALLWGASNLWHQHRARRRNEALVEALAVPAQRPDPAAAERAEIARRFAEALHRLKARRLGGKGNRRWLYELPWYVMIGPPGSGKTTALVQSGLAFPLGAPEDLRGVGGTRHCDWLFTEEAVLVDTAGRYTTRESDPEVDAAAWGEFLELLRRHRPRQPLNGVLVALSVTDLLDAGRTGLEHARAIRARLDELETKLGLRLPVYLLITKLDLVAGFAETLGELSEGERGQVWGVTLPVETAPEALRGALAEGLDQLVAQLERLLPERLGAERELERRARILGFPAQLAALAPEILKLLDGLVADHGWARAPYLRGVYLTSATQAGTPVDRLVAAIARSMGLPEPALQPQAADRSFFLTRLLREVVFAEASLVARDPVRERREALRRGAALAGLALVSAGAIGGWVWSYVQNRERILALEAGLAGWAREAAPVARDRLGPADAALAPVVGPLDRLRALAAPLASDEPWSMRLGLSERATAASLLDTAYREALRDLLLPRLLLRLERQMRARLLEPDYLLEALKVHLALVGRAPADPELVSTWFALDLAAGEPALAGPLGPHLEALGRELAALDPKPAADETLLEQVRATLARLPLAKRAYRALLARPEVQALPPWRASEAAGPHGPAALVRRSGRPLGAPVPGIFTHAAFHGVFLPILEEAAREAFAEAWVLGAELRPEPSAAELARLRTDMLALYYDDAIAAWQGVLDDVTLVPLGELAQTAEVAKALSGPSSPIRLLLRAVLAERRLTRPPPEADAQGTDPAKAAAAAAKALGPLAAKVGRLARLVGGASRPEAETPGEPPGAPVEQRFAALAVLVEGADGAPPALDAALAALGTLSARLQEALLSPDPRAKLAEIGPLAAGQLAREAARLPAPVGPMLAGLARTVGGATTGALRERINAVWQAEVLPFCRLALGGRFPFARTSPIDASLEDTARLFAPGGLIDGFVRTHLAAHVDTTRRPWQPLQGVALAQAPLAALERAKRIGGALFPAGPQPKVAFSLTPLELDAAAASVSLDLDGQELRYDHGPAQPRAMLWPGPGGSGIVRLSFAPLDGGPPATVIKEGAWSLFRLMQEGELKGLGQPDLFELALRAGRHRARFRLKAGSVENPFDLGLFAGFACPEGL
ncbi:MAG: type VI secretion system membrane subunit TssM [Geminicoccaceae bacterium]|nr:type VI secretion system membrane subunit TssM [Geminicoccaceae bacterium]